MVYVSGIEKSYGKKSILCGVDFEAGPGEQAVITGKNGCGKTTLLHIMAGVLKPDSGTVSYFGHDILTERKAVNRYCGFLPQGDCLMEELSVRDNINLWRGKGGTPDKQLLDFFDLNDLLDNRIRDLSGGMKRRVSIACAAVGLPPVLLLDEPTNGLDIYQKKEVLKFLRRYRDMNGVVILVSHDENEIRESSICLELRDGIINRKGVNYE